MEFAINEQTHALDLSAVYGKNLEISDALRLFKDGKLQYNEYSGVPYKLSEFGETVDLHLIGDPKY